MIRAAAAGLTLLAVAQAPPVEAAVYALVIGIDAYEHISVLGGAVNDARDIADALSALQADDVRVLLDGEATREAIMRHWRELAAKAGEGDVLVVSYAGHGGSEPEARAGDELDGRDETLLLAGFSESGPGAAERIRDDEIAALIALSPDATVVVLADSCHSGTVTRSAVTSMRFRNHRITEIANDPLPPPPPAAPSERSLEDAAVFFAAVPDAALAPEMEIGGEVRGALSFAFAQALRGAADTDADGLITKGEIERHVRSFVRNISNGQQHPQVAPPGLEQTVLFHVASRVESDGAAGAETGPATDLAGDDAAPFENAFASLPPTPLRIRGAETPALLRSALTGVAHASAIERQAVVWDVPGGVLRSGLGDVLRVLPAGAPVDQVQDVQAVVDKMRAVFALERATLAQGLTLRFAGGDGLYAEGDAVTAVVENRRFDHLVLVNLASTGEIQAVYPLAEYGDPIASPAAGGLVLEGLVVKPPFGADHLVAIETQDDAPALRRALLRHNGGRDIAALWTDLHHALRGRAHAIGLFPFFTQAR